MAEKELSIQEIQQRIRQNKKNKNLPLNDLAVDLAWIHEELGELARAQRRGRADEFIEELVDISIFILGIFAMLKVNGWEMVLKKIKMNEATAYEERDGEEDGFHVRSYIKRERATLFDVEFDKEEFKRELEREPSIRKIQKRIWQNKLDKGFKTDDVNHDLVCMIEEAGEAAWARRMGLKEKLLDALTDLLIYTWGIFEMKGVDGYKQILKKMKRNEARKYKKEDKDMGLALTRTDFVWK